MEVRCPQCHTPIDPGADSLMSELVCVGCGGTFSLAGDEETVTLRDGKPRTLGHFELLERVGAGSFGAVWRARDEELDRTVAIKIPRKGDLDSDEVQRFLHEAQAAAQLRHENIVSVHEVGRECDTLYIVSDFVRGPTLKERLVDSRFTPQEAAHMCVQIADGLEHAHKAGVVHRDLKPGNILIDTEGVPHIVDFGLARRDAGEVTMTLEGRVFGTPAYAPPEQARGDANQADRRSDVYSLGVVLFELLTGERPFRGNVQMILQHVIYDDAPSPRRFNGNVPQDLETICMKCMEKSPGKRYQTARDLRDDLRRFLDGVPIHARPVSSIERGTKWMKRHPTISVLVACIILLTTAGVTAIGWQWRKVVNAQKSHAHTQVERVLNADPQVVESVISSLDDFRQWADPALMDLLSHEQLSKKHRYRANLALLPVEPERAEYIFQQLLSTDGDSRLSTAELVYGAEALRGYRDQADDTLWGMLEDPGQPYEQRIRAALILAKLQGSSPTEEFRMRFGHLATFIANELIELSVAFPADFRVLVEAMRPLGSLLLSPLEQLVVDDQNSDGKRLAATSFFGEYVDSDFDRLTTVLLQIKDEQYVRLLPFVKRNLAEIRDRLLPWMNATVPMPTEEDADDVGSGRRAKAIVTLMHLGYSKDKIWPLLEPSDDMHLRTSLIQCFAELRLPQQVLMERILQGLHEKNENPGTLRALILSLSEYASVEPNSQQALMTPLMNAYQHHPDSGIHSSIARLFRDWGNVDALEEMTVELAQFPPDDVRNWYVNSEAITMAVVRNPTVFLMGSPDNEPGHDPEERLHWRKIDRDYSISTTEITWSQMTRYANSDPECGFVHRDIFGPAQDGPALPVTWTQAAKYCRWLSEMEEIDKDQMCFPEISEISGNMVLPTDYLERTGYRLPTEGEWEYACRAGTTTRRFYGDSDRFMGKYGWYVENCHDRAWPVGSLRPNELGLFDVYGNVWEWCTDRFGRLPQNTHEQPFLDFPKTEMSKGYVLRGGSIMNRVSILRSGKREYQSADYDRNHNVGFRIARTMPGD